MTSYKIIGDKTIAVLAHNGQQGPQGKQGVPGYTPVKGVDYWTDEDIEEIDSYIDAQTEPISDDSIDELFEEDISE